MKKADMPKGTCWYFGEILTLKVPIVNHSLTPTGMVQCLYWTGTSGAQRGSL